MPAGAGLDPGIMQSTSGTAPDRDELIRRATVALRCGETDAAEALLSGPCEAPDADAALLALAGAVAFRRGDVTAARRRLGRALTLNPEDIDTRYNLGVALMHAGDGPAAAKCFREVLVRNPAQEMAATNLAELMLRQGAYPDAAEVCRQALERAPEAGRLWLALAEALRRGGDLDGAEGALERAAGLLPGHDPDLLNRRGILCKARGRPAEAVALYRRALASAPSRAGIHNNLGLALLALGHIGEAHAAFDMALRHRPGWPEAQLNRAAALARLGRRTEAEAAARAALAGAPESRAAQAALAALLSGGRDPERLGEAERLARRALQSRAAPPGAHDTLGIVLMKRGRSEEAIEAGRAAVTAAPDVPAHAEHLADHLARLDRLEEAAAVLEAALARVPGDTVLERQLGIVRLRAGDAAAGLALLDRRLADHAQDQRAIAHKAVCLERLGQVAAARELLGLDRYIRAVGFEDVAPFEDLAAFNRALADDIRAHPTLQWEPVGLAARGGALTGELMDAPTDAIRVFVRELRRAIGDWIGELGAEQDHPFPRGAPAEYRLNTWATLVPPKGEIGSHIHEESWLSGAYYPLLPDTLGDGEDRAGWIEFGRPSTELPPVPEDALRWIRPEEGLLLLFPSYLFHRTIPFEGGGERISVSFDVEPERP